MSNINTNTETYEILIILIIKGVHKVAHDKQNHNDNLKDKRSWNIQNSGSLESVCRIGVPKTSYLSCP